jgi:hypothetical protein
MLSSAAIDLPSNRNCANQMIWTWKLLAAEILKIDANSPMEHSPRRLGQKPKAAHHRVIQITRTCPWLSPTASATVASSLSL